jgi:nucleoside phosphorylase
MLAVLTAMDWEMNAVAKSIRAADETAEQDLRLCRTVARGEEVLVVRTGMGRARAEAGVTYVLDRYRLRLLLLLGVAGGIAPGLRVGDVVVCAMTRCGDSADACRTDPGLVEKACAALAVSGLRCRAGTGVTVPGVATTIAEKQRLWKTGPVDICEMEDFWIACVAAGRQTPFLSVRVVVDEAGVTLPSLQPVMDVNGKLRTWGAVGYFFGHPRVAFRIPGLYRRWRSASGSLAAAAAGAVEALAGGAA